MEDLGKLTTAEKSAMIEEGRFFIASEKMAIKENVAPVLVKATSNVHKGFFSCKVLGPDRSEKVTCQTDRACEVGNVLMEITAAEAAMLAEERGASISDQAKFLQ